MKIFAIIILIAAALVFLSLLLAYICYRLAFRADRNPPDPYKLLDKEKYAPYKELSEGLIRNLASREYTACEISSRDGLKLFGKLYQGNIGAPVHIMFHGYRSQSGWDFSGGAEECLALGHSVLLVDQRSHGKSEGHAISFGVREGRDVHSWADYIGQKFDTDIYIWGLSMGAASVLMSLDEPFCPSVRGVIADCPYSSPADIISLVTSRMHLPPLLMMPFVRLGAIVYGGFRLGNASAMNAVRCAKIPVLLIHGDGDDFVPYKMSEEIYESASAAGVDIEFHTFKDAGHGMSYLSSPAEYRSVVWAFIEKTRR